MRITIDDLTRERLLALADDAAEFPETVTIETVLGLAEFTRSTLRATPHQEEP